MAKITSNMSMSLDGFIAGPNISMNNPMGDNGEGLHDWMFTGKSANEATAFQEQIFRNTGAIVVGRRMIDLGERHWGDNPVFHAPVFVVTHRPREKVVKQGGTSYNFVTDGIENVLKQAKAVVGDKDIEVAGGASVVQQFMKAGWLDELQIHLIPILLGGGTRLFEQIDGLMQLESIRVEEASGVTHLTYRFVK